MKKILVTGAAGTIGTALCKRLLDLNYDVVGVDKRINKWSERVNKINIVGNLLGTNVYEELPKDVDCIVHLAANARVFDLVKEPKLALENIDMLFNVLEYARAHNIKKIIFSSSRKVYGNTATEIYNEDSMNVVETESPYTASKISGESLLHSYRNCYGIDFVILRFSNVYGNYDDSNRVVPEFIKNCMQNKDLEIFGKDKLLDFTYLDDCIDGVMLVIEKFDEVKNDIFNIASGDSVGISTVADLIKENLKSNSNINYGESRVGEVVKCILDISKAKEKLSYKPKIKIDKGIELTVKNYKR